MLRRQFLHRSFSLGAVSAAGLSIPKLAYASAQEDRYFIFCWFRGGWDILLGLDPRDPDVFTDDQAPWTQIETGYDRLESVPTTSGHYNGILSSSVPQLQFGPYIGELIHHADKMSVVRGMSMETLGHAQGMRRFLTGKPPIGLNARGSSMGTVFADIYGATKSIPNLCMAIETYNDGLSLDSTGVQVQSLNDLLLLLEGTTGSFSIDVRNRIDQFLQENVDASRSAFLQKSMASQLSARTLVDLELASDFDFSAQTEEMSLIRSAFQLTDYDDFSDPNIRAAMAAKAITGGVSRCVSMRINNQLLDTHDSDYLDQQGPRQESSFNAISRLVDYLSSVQYDSDNTWLDKTTIIGFSEFSRTALINSRQGRDHSLTNACFLIGAGIQPGKLVGASSDVGMGTQAVNLQTGEPDENGEVIRPEHIHMALLKSIGVEDDIADLRVDPLEAILT